jgi:hypothetical protein
MPQVKTQTSVKAVAVPKAVEVDTVSQNDLAEYVPVFTQFVNLSKQLNAIKKNYEAMCLKVLVAATGIKNEDAIKAMTPEAVAELVEKRMANGTFKFEAGQYDFEIAPSQPNGRATVQWQQIVLDLKGEDYVKQVQADAPKSFSYKVIPTTADGKHIVE